jgi:hypothetical protein
MKLRLLFTIAIPALCGTWGIALRSMDTYAALTNFSAKVMGAFDESKNLSEKEKLFLQNLRKNSEKSEFEEIFNTLCDEAKIARGNGRRYAAFNNYCRYEETKDGKRGTFLVPSLYHLTYSKMPRTSSVKEWEEEANITAVALALTTYALGTHTHDTDNYAYTAEVPLKEFASVSFFAESSLVIEEIPLTGVLIKAYKKIVNLCANKTSFAEGVQHRLVRLIRGLILPAGKHMGDLTKFYNDLDSAFRETSDIQGLSVLCGMRYEIAQTEKDIKRAFEYFLGGIRSIVTANPTIVLPENWLEVIPNNTLGISIIEEWCNKSKQTAFKTILRTAAEKLLAQKAPEGKASTPVFIEDAASKYLIEKALQENANFADTPVAEKYDGKYFSRIIKTLRTIAEDKNALQERAQKCARNLALKNDALYSRSSEARNESYDDQCNARFIATLITDEDWKNSNTLSAQANLFDLIGIGGCLAFTQANVFSKNISVLNFIQSFLKFKQKDTAVENLLKDKEYTDLLIKIQNGTAQDEIRKAAAKKEPIIETPATPVAPVDSTPSKKEESLIPEHKSEASTTGFTFANQLARIKTLAKIMRQHSKDTPVTKELKYTADGMYCLEPDTVAEASTESDAAEATQPHRTSWQPAIFKTALVAGLGAACWWQWNAVKTLTTRTIPDSLYALFARIQRASA